MTRKKRGGAKPGNDLKSRLKIAATELVPLLEDVRRDRDRLVAESLTLRFVWHEAGHPHPGKLWDVGYDENLTGYWIGAGHSFGRMALPTKEEPMPYDCRIYLVGGDRNVCECFTQRCREAEAVFNRMAGDGTHFNWAYELFDTFRDAVDEEGRDAVEWRENEEPDRPETWSYVAELRDVFQWTITLLKVFVDGAESRRRSLDDPMIVEDPGLTPGSTYEMITEIRELLETVKAKFKALEALTEWQLQSLSPPLLDYGGTKTPVPTVTSSNGKNNGQTEFAFQPDGDGYFISGFNKKGHFTAKRAKGLHDIFRLVQTPGDPVPMLELDAGVGTIQLEGDSKSRQPVANSETRQDITAKRAQLLADIAKAKTDFERDELREELETLETAVMTLFGLAGKARDLNNPINRLRAKLLARKKTACKSLKEGGLAALAEHLDLTIGAEGNCLVYRSTAPNIAWNTAPKE